MSDRELKTSEVAAMLGVKPDVIHTWKRRGLLPLSPKRSSGLGRSQECLWSPVAVREAKAVNTALLKRRPRTRVFSKTDGEG